MTGSENPSKPGHNWPSSRLLNDRCRLPVERLVSEHYGRPWRVRDFNDLDDFASHPAAILSDGARPVFVKLSEAMHGLDQFEVELAGLQLLTEQAGILTPTSLGIASAGGAVILVLEGVRPVARGAEQWREIGRTLARIHLVKGRRFGHERQGYFGSLYQDNRPMPGWLSFYSERRLWPYLIGAIDSGHMPVEAIRLVERLIRRLPELDIPDAAPTLLHGDAQQNNFISTAVSAFAVDPAVYYGHPEMDLAYVDFFEPVPGDLFAGYRELLPIEPGFAERRELWRIAAYLAIVQASGPGELGKLIEAVRKYV